MTEDTVTIPLNKLLKLTHDIDEDRFEFLFRNFAIEIWFIEDHMLVGVGKNFVKVVLEE